MVVTCNVIFRIAEEMASNTSPGALEETRKMLALKVSGILKS